MFIATREDKSLSLPLNGRDPLGTQAVWQYRARDVVPALTAASRQAEGFQLLLTALAWWPEFARRHKRPATDLKRYFLLFEQAFARACRTAGMEWCLPGTRRLGAGAPGVWVGLDQKQHYLLDSPLANGTWGIYRGPAINAGLIDDENRIVLGRLEETIRRSTQGVECLFRGINAALHASVAESTSIAKNSSHRLVGDLSQILAKLPLKVHIRQTFVAPHKAPLTTALAELAMDEPDEEPGMLIRRALRHIPEHRTTLTNVQRCEQYLAPLDAAFEQLCHDANKRLDGASLENYLPALRKAQEEFAQSGLYQGLAAERSKQLREAPLSSAAALVKYLLEQHQRISDARGSAPWISVGGNGRISCRLAVTEPSTDQLTGQQWRNSYYLDTLRTLALRVAPGGR